MSGMILPKNPPEELAHEIQFHKRINAGSGVQSLGKNIHLRFSENYDFHKFVPPDTEGRFGQSSRNVGAGCDGRFEALSARACPARTNDALRTAKSCGLYFEGR